MIRGEQTTPFPLGLMVDSSSVIEEGVLWSRSSYLVGKHHTATFCDGPAGELMDGEPASIADFVPVYLGLLQYDE